MAYVYILYSIKLDRFYTGSCLDLEQRLVEHRDKAFGGSFTSKAGDWELFLSICDLKYEQARNIESHIKKMRSKKYIISLKQYPELCKKLVNRYQ